MSKSITEKELAEKLAGIYGDINDYDWPTVARTAAELLGAELAPEKPEPGTWHLTKDGSPARVNWDGSLHAYYPDGEFDIRHDDIDWPALTTARVTPEAEWAALVEERDLCKARVEIAEARVSELRAELAGANETLTELAPAEPVELSEAEVKESANVEWAAYRKDYGPNPTWTNVSHRAFHAGYRAALAKHGHGRVEVSREQVQAILTDWYRSDRSEPLSEAVNAVMELLEASK